MLERGTGGDVFEVDRDATGFDFLLRSARGAVLVRCEPGAEPPPLAVARELTGSMADQGASAAWIVAASRPTRELTSYLETRPISVVAPWRLEGATDDSG